MSDLCVHLFVPKSCGRSVFVLLINLEQILSHIKNQSLDDQLQVDIIFGTQKHEKKKQIIMHFYKYKPL